RSRDDDPDPRAGAGHHRGRDDRRLRAPRAGHQRVADQPLRPPRLPPHDAVGRTRSPAGRGQLSNRPVRLLPQHPRTPAQMTAPAESEFDAYAQRYETSLQEGLRYSGEDSAYFAQERVEWVARQ